MEPRQKLFEETIQNHQRTLPDGEPRDFIDSYLQEVERSTDPESIFHKSNAGGRNGLPVDGVKFVLITPHKLCFFFHEAKGLQAVIADFFLAGQDTTTSTFSWLILYLLCYQDVQTKLQEEIDRIVGKKFVSLADRNRSDHIPTQLNENLYLDYT